jgi:hypothetical protein
MENVLLLDGDNIRRNGRIANSFGDKALSWTSGEDVGATAGEVRKNASSGKSVGNGERQRAAR